jgi:hypothetical protein
VRIKMVYTFERMTLNCATTCVEFAFSELAREMFFVTMEYVTAKYVYFLPWPSKSFQYLFEIFTRECSFTTFRGAIGLLVIDYFIERYNNNDDFWYR